MRTSHPITGDSMFYIPTEEADRTYRRDEEYTVRDSTLTNLILEQSISHSIDTLSKVKFDKISDFDKYNRFINVLPELYTDVSAYVEQVKRIELANPFEGIVTGMEVPTYIKEETKIVLSNVSDLIPVAKSQLDASTYDDFKDSIAGIIWLSANIVNMKEYPKKYSQEVLTEIEDILGKVEDLNLTYEKFVKGEISLADIPDFTKEIATLKYNSENYMKSIPLPLIFFANFLTYYPKIDKFLQSVNKGLVQAGNMFNSVASQLGDWGDFLKNPISAMINVANGMVGISLAGLNLVSNVYSSVSESIIPAEKSLSKNPYKENKDKPLHMMVFESIFMALKSVMSLMKGIMNVFFNTIKMSFQMFFNVFSSLVKTLKSIAETSPVFQTIMEYMYLAMNMLFLPFFTSFAEPLIGYVTEFVTFTMILGARLNNYFQDTDTMLNEHLTDALDKILKSAEKIIKKVQEEMLEKGFDKLKKPLLDFIESFMNVIIENSSKIGDFLDKGLDVLDELLESGMLKTLLKIGKDVFQWIIDNKEFFEGLFDFVDSFINISLKFVRWVLNNIELATIAILTAVGTACGAIGGLQAGLATAWFTFGLSVPAATAIGASLGASAGLASALYILYEWITPAKQEVESLLSDVPKYGSGGKIYGRRGGHIGLLGEVGQGEYAIPESKVDLFRGNNNIIVKFKKGVYNQRAVDDVMSELRQELVFDNLFY